MPFYYFKDMKTDKPPTARRTDQPLTQHDHRPEVRRDDPELRLVRRRTTATTWRRCGITAGDNWLKQRPCRPSSTRRPGPSSGPCSILTWDEGATKAFGPELPQPRTHHPARLAELGEGRLQSSSQRTDQYGLLRTVDKALGLAPLTNNDRYAATVNDAWK